MIPIKVPGSTDALLITSADGIAYIIRKVEEVEGIQLKATHTDRDQKGGEQQFREHVHVFEEACTVHHPADYLRLSPSNHGSSTVQRDLFTTSSVV